VNCDVVWNSEARIKVDLSVSLEAQGGMAQIINNLDIRERYVFSLATQPNKNNEISGKSDG